MGLITYIAEMCISLIHVEFISTANIGWTVGIMKVLMYEFSEHCQVSMEFGSIEISVYFVELR